MRMKKFLIVLLAVSMMMCVGCKVDQMIDAEIIAFNGVEMSAVPDPLPAGEIFTVTCEKNLGDVDLTRIFEVPRVLIEPYAGASSIPLLLVIDISNYTVMYYLEDSLIYGATWAEVTVDRLVEIIRHLLD